MQYAKHVKPGFEDFIHPTKKYADVIIPRGADNDVAIDLIVQHIRTKLGQNDLCKIYSNVFVIHSTFQVLLDRTPIQVLDVFEYAKSVLICASLFLKTKVEQSHNTFPFSRCVGCIHLCEMKKQPSMTLFFMQIALFVWYDCF